MGSSSYSKGSHRTKLGNLVINPREDLLRRQRAALARVVAKANNPTEAHRHVLCAVTDTKAQQVAVRMAAYRRRGFLIADRAKALGL